MIYSELQTAIADYTHRSDLVAKIPSLIAQAEAKLFRELNIKALNIILAGTTTGEYITLPLPARSMKVFSLPSQTGAYSPRSPFEVLSKSF